MLDESNQMRSAYSTIHPGKNPPSSKRLPVEIRFFFSTAPVSHPPFPRFNRTFHKTNRPPLHQIPVLPGHFRDGAADGMEGKGREGKGRVKGRGGEGRVKGGARECTYSNLTICVAICMI
jgi:hypothetical protein